MKLPKMPKMPFGGDFDKLMKKAAGGEGVVVNKQGHSTTVVTGGTISGNASGYAEGGRAGSLKARSTVSSSGDVEFENTVDDKVPCSSEI